MSDVYLKCPECGRSMKLRKSTYGLFFACTQWPTCPGTHGANSEGKPLGIPADRDTKQARIDAHDIFERMMRMKQMTRSQAYTWLANRLGITGDECHMGKFDQAQCERVIEICTPHMKGNSQLEDLIKEKIAEKNSFILQAQSEQACGNDVHAREAFMRAGDLESRITFLKAAVGDDDYHINAVSAVSCWMSAGASKRIAKFRSKAKRLGLKLTVEGFIDA